MFESKLKCEKILRDHLYTYAHVNITGIDIHKDINSLMNRIIFTISNTNRTRMIRSYNYISKMDIELHGMKQSHIYSIIYEANKLASLIDEVPDHIPDEQTKKWLKLRMDKI